MGKHKMVLIFSNIIERSENLNRAVSARRKVSAFINDNNTNDNNTNDNNCKYINFKQKNLFSVS